MYLQESYKNWAKNYRMSLQKTEATAPACLSAFVSLDQVHAGILGNMMLDNTDMDVVRDILFGAAYAAAMTHQCYLRQLRSHSDTIDFKTANNPARNLATYKAASKSEL